MTKNSTPNLFDYGTNPPSWSGRNEAMIEQLPLHDAPSLDMAELPVVIEKQVISTEPDQSLPQTDNKQYERSWLYLGHGLVTVSLFAIVIGFTGSGIISFALMLLAVVNYWQYQRQHIMELEHTIFQLNQNVEHLSDKAWELREGEERYRSLVDAFGDSVMHRSTDGTVTFVNDSFAKIFSQDTATLINAIFSPESFSIEGDFPPLDKHGTLHEISIGTDGAKRWYSWLNVPIRDGVTGQAAVRSIVRDVTQHKETELALRLASEKAETASRAKTRFLANVSHEMRTPLNGILGMSDLLDDTTLSPDQNTYNEAIHTSGAALLTLIEDLLDITRIEANKFEIRRDVIDIAHHVEHVAELLSVRAHAKDIGLSTYISNKISDRVTLDSGRLRQVLINLLGNAVKFTEQGEVCLRVFPVENASTNDPDRALIRFEVEDTGPGISPKDKLRIFDEFVQVDAENTRKYGGAGLGLAISQAIIREMGGEIFIEDARGESGTIFSFELLLETYIENDPSQQLLSNRKILIASDSKLESWALSQIIKDAGGLIKPVGNSAVEADCLLVDVSTIENPIEYLANHKSKTSSNFRSIILLPPEKRKALQHYLDNGFDAFLIKPVRGNSLLKILDADLGVQKIPKFDIAPTKKFLAVKLQAGNSRILLAEDNEINALLAKSILEKQGHTVCRVENGEMAVAKFEENTRANTPFDLVLMDLHMPVMDGIDAIGQISKFEKDNQLPPVQKIIVSADEQSETRLEAEAAGANDYLIKPINPARLLEIARECAA